MRSRLPSTAFAMVLVCAACAQGSSLPGGVGGAGAHSATGLTASSSVGTTTSSSTLSSSDVSSFSGTSCSESPCKLTTPQCGCPSGEACTIDQSQVACLTSGTTGLTQACSATELCAPGLLCVQAGASASICDKFCDSDADCTAPGGLCIVTLNDGHGGAIPDVTLCTDNCDPVTNAGCPASGTSCQVGQEPTGQMRNLTFCTGAGTLGQGETCDPTNNECLPTYGCISNVCLQYCDAANPSCVTCAPLQNSTTMTDIFIGSTQIGVCE
jgi:hypothetical protein